MNNLIWPIRPNGRAPCQLARAVHEPGPTQDLKPHFAAVTSGYAGRSTNAGLFNFCMNFITGILVQFCGLSMVFGGPHLTDLPVVTAEFEQARSSFGHSALHLVYSILAWTREKNTPMRFIYHMHARTDTHTHIYILLHVYTASLCAYIYNSLYIYMSLDIYIYIYTIMSACYIIYTNTITCVIMCVCVLCVWCLVWLGSCDAFQESNISKSINQIKSLKNHIKNQHSNSHGTHGIQCIYCMYIYIYIYIYLHISNHIKYSRINPKLYPSDTNRSR